MITNNVVNASTTINGLVNCTIDTTHSNIATPPNLDTKQVEICCVLQPGNSEAPILGKPAPPPPYDVPVYPLSLARTLLTAYQKPPLQNPTVARSEKVLQLGSSNLINKPTITPSSYVVHPANESPEVLLRVCVVQGNFGGRGGNDN